MAIFGDNTAGATSFPAQDGRCLVTLFTLAEDATINSAGAYFHSSTTAGASAKLVIYGNSGGAPGARVAVSSASVVPAGGGLVSFALTGSLPAGSYFLGVVCNSHQPYHLVDLTSGMTTVMANGSMSYASPQTTWPSVDASYPQYRMNAWVDYTAAAAGPTQTLAFTLDGVSAAVAQALSRIQTLSGDLDGVGFVASQAVNRTQSAAFSLDDLGASSAQVAQHSQQKAASLDSLTVSGAQTAIHGQALAASLDDVFGAVAQSVDGAETQAASFVLDGVSVEVLQQLRHVQSGGAVLEDIQAQAAQSVAKVISQAMAAALADISCAAIQAAGAALATGISGRTNYTRASGRTSRPRQRNTVRA